MDTRIADMAQADVVEAIAELANRWRDPAYLLRQEAEQLIEPFPFTMVQVSLNGLLDSLTPLKLWQLIDLENVRDSVGYPVIGHVIAGNTPLLAWVSVIRALLVRSASIVKLPTGPAAEWGRLFHRSLANVSPTLAACVEMRQWQGGETEHDTALCEQSDLILAYGSDETILRLRKLCPREKPLIGCGHRVSFGLIPRGSDITQAAEGLATDILLYDQGGCLSPQTVFVEGNMADVLEFGEQLTTALTKAVEQFPLPCRVPQAAMRVQEARLLARMGQGTQVWEDLAQRWTVIARPDRYFVPSPGFGVVSVQPLASVGDLSQALHPVNGHLQGCVLAANYNEYRAILNILGVSYICPSGSAQSPPLGWREDGRDVLRCLLPGAWQDNDLSR